jgi:hypothetical protein
MTRLIERLIGSNERVIGSNERLIVCLTRLDRRLDAFADVYFNSRFPHGQPTDQWSRRRRGHM